MLEIGTLLDGKYKILSEIGHGGMSVVYMALNEKANKTWAVKEVRKDGRMDFNVVRQGLVAEIETLKRLKHPNLPSIVDVIEDEDSFIIVMDYIEGNSLDIALKEHGAQPEEYVVEWAKQLCDVLGYLHSCNPPIIYRDMKPANIMLKPDGNIALIDFGTAKTYEVDLGETAGIGTIGYAAPEQYTGSGFGRTDARTDIYCLGITLYHLLTGVDPCQEFITDHSIRAKNPSLSPGLDQIILKCTQRDPADRYQSCAELLYALEHSEELVDSYRKKQRRKLIRFIACVGMTMLFAGISLFSNYMSTKKIAESYNGKINDAKGAILETAQNDLKEAIELDPTKKEAYSMMIDLLMRDNKLSAQEQTVFIEWLKMGDDTVGRLKEKDPKAYADICSDIGYSYWFSYEVESERFTKAADWFDLASEDDETAKAFKAIGECYKNINKYKTQSRNTKLKDEYKTLWNMIYNNLYVDAVKIDDVDNRRNALHEVINCISNNVLEFTKALDGDPENKIEEVISGAKKQLEQLANNTSDSETKQLLMGLIGQADDAVKRAGAAKKEVAGGIQ